MRRLRHALLCLAWLHAAAGVARGQDAVRVLGGEHPGFSRVAFVFPNAVAYHVSRDGDRVLLRFDTTAAIGNPASFPRNVLAYAGGASQAEIVVAHGAQIQWRTVANGVAVDILDAPGRKEPPGRAPLLAAMIGTGPPAAPAVAPRASDNPIAPPGARAPTPPAASAALAAPAALPAPGAAVASPPVAAVAPKQGEAVPLSAERAVAATPPAPLPVAPPAADGAAAALAAVAGPPGTIRLPFGSATGVAAFRRGATAVLVFDERRPIELGGVRGDPVFSAASVQLQPEATIIRVPLAPATALALRRAEDGWVVVAGAAGGDIQPITPVTANRELALAAAAPGRVLSVPDPDTGGLLLLGTQRQAGQAITAARQTAEFELLTTWQGIAVDPLSASIFLRGDKDGFVLGAEPGGLALAPQGAGSEAYAAASALARRFDFPPLPTQALQSRLQGEIEALAEAAPLARARGRRAAAETMVALGLDAEAQGMLRLAAAEDARALDDPDAVGLSAIAALLAGRDGEADGLSDKRLDGTDEIALWRAVRQARATEGSAAAASVFAATLPLVLAYPDPLRDRLLPLVAETLAANDQPAAGKLLARWPDDPRLKLARGLFLQAKGDRDGALAAYDQLTGGPDRLTRVRATRRAVELRLAAGQIDARQAADALERELLAWRGDQQEIDLRLRLAALRAQAGEWRAALALLRETEALGTEEQPAAHAQLLSTFAAMCEDRNADKLPPLDLVAMLDEYADLLPAGEPGTDLAARLADRLVALDLPRRAEAVLARLVRATAGPVRASFGVRLAGLRLREGGPADALATLADTEAEGLPPAIQQQRTMLRARALAARGDAPGASRLLADVGTVEAAELRATILEGARDWPGAEQAWTEYASHTVPPEGALTDGQKRTLLRLAGAASQAGDAVTLGTLGRREGKRMETGALGDVFKLLTARPVEGGADLPRAANEIALARSLSSGLRAVGSPRDR